MGKDVECVHPTLIREKYDVLFDLYRYRCVVCGKVMYVEGVLKFD